MGVGGGADRDGVGVDRHRVLEAGGNEDPEFGTDRFSGLGEDVEYAHDLGTGNPTVEVLGVHRADASTAEHDETNGHQETLLSLEEYSAGLADRSTPTTTPSAAAEAAAASTTAWAA